MDIPTRKAELLTPNLAKAKTPLEKMAFFGEICHLQNVNEQKFTFGVQF